MSKAPATQVQVIGPNLGGDFVFHVHKAGCADLKKAKYRHADGSGDGPVALASKQAVVEYIYDGQIFSDNAGDPVWGKWDAYEPDFEWFPCLGDFPDEAPAPTPTPTPTYETMLAQLGGGPTYGASVEIMETGELTVLVTRNVPAGVCGPFDWKTIVGAGGLKHVPLVLASLGFTTPETWKLAQNGFFYGKVEKMFDDDAQLAAHAQLADLACGCPAVDETLASELAAQIDAVTR